MNYNTYSRSIKESDYKLALKAPIFSVTSYSLPSFVDKKYKNDPFVLLCSGGGSSKTGVSNSIIIARLIRNEDGKLDCEKWLEYNSDQLYIKAVCSHDGVLIFAIKSYKCTVFKVSSESENKFKLEKVTSFSNPSESSSSIYNCVACDEEGQLVAIGDDRGSLSLFSFHLNQRIELGSDKPEPLIHIIGTVQAHKSTILSLTFHPSYEYLLSTSTDGTACVLNTSTAECVQIIQLPSKFPKKTKIASALFIDFITLLLLVVAPTGKSFIMKYTPYSRKHEIQWELKESQCVSKIDSASMCIDPTHQYIGIGDLDGAVTIFKYDDKQEYLKQQLELFTQTHKAHDLPVTSLTSLLPSDSLYLEYINPKYQGYICSCSADYTLSLRPIQYNVKSRKGLLFLLLFILLLLLCLFTFYLKPELGLQVFEITKKFISEIPERIHYEL